MVCGIGKQNIFADAGFARKGLYLVWCGLSPVRAVLQWIEHHLRIKAFYGTSEGAVKTQMVFPIDQTLNRRMPLWQPMQARLSWRSLTNCPS